MPGFMTGLDEYEVTRPQPKPVKKVVVTTVVALALFATAPVASAGNFVNLDPNNHVPNPGWEVD